MTGLMRLDEDHLGSLELAGCSGYVVESFDLGTAEVRKAQRTRALGHGTFDDTQFLGSRACSITVRIDQRVNDPQTLLDTLAAFNNPRLRPSLTWSIPGSSQQRSFRGMVGRGFPMPIAGPTFHATTFQWEVPDGKIVDPVPTSFVLNPSSDTEPGRTYPENFADGGRGPYPPSAGRGGRLLFNRGGIEADWRAQLFGPAVQPFIRVNGVTINFNNNGGVTLVAGEFILIDTYTRQVVLNGDPTLSRYSKSNYTAWSWQSVRVPTGQSSAVIGAASGTPSALYSFSSTWQ